MFVTIDEFEEVVSEVLDELPEAFFEGLTGGVIIEEEAKLSDNAKNDDLYSLGTYTSDKRGGQITIFYGSFEKIYANAQGEALKRAVRNVVRHEFRHHLEFRSGMHGIDSLEEEDNREMEEYLARHE